MSSFSMAWTVLRKELLEALRDRRTIVLTIFVPLILYPLMVGSFGFFTGKKQLDDQSRALAVRVAGDGADQVESVRADLQRLSDAAGEDARYVGAEHPLRRGADAVVHVAPVPHGLALNVEYQSTSEGRATRLRVGETLRDLVREHEARRLAELGLEKAQIEPITVVWTDVATPAVAHGREAAGMLVYFLLFLSFTACLSVAIDVGAGEKERGTMETLLTTPANRGALFAGKLMAVVIVGCSSVFFSVLGMGGMVMFGATQSPQLAALVGGLLHWEALAVAVPMLLSGVLLLASSTLAISLRAESAKQAQATIAPLLMVVVIVLIAGATPAVRLDWSTVFVPVLNLALSVRALITTEANQWVLIAIAEVVTIAGIVVTIRLGARALRSERVLGR
ncbi:ABC transporter permease [Sulfuriroseicoccus oceanibius]|uniref:ABC transporter permease n=1 Tax=Sulfuriroseicoccus oceanibius TaxID=2707525 RepID=A0A7T7JB63_9BACT|nr:ABC transporter permease [Sulfuriroseicoccus oceanibius]QQL43855.1 ABC transporter permease [Sulfuriroseicoccus oceanibius]